MLCDRLHGHRPRGVGAEDHAVAHVLCRHGNHRHVLARSQDLHAGARVPAVTPRRQVHQVDLASAVLADLAAALVEAEEERRLQAPAVLRLVVGVVVAHVSLRHLQGDLVRRVVNLHDEGGRGLGVHVALERPHLLKPRRAGDPARRVGNTCDLRRAQVGVHQPALVDDVEEGDKVVDAEPGEPVADAVALGRRHVADRHVADRRDWGGHADADVRHPIVPLHVEDGAGPVALDGHVPLGALALVDVAGEDAPGLHGLQVLEEAVRGHVRRAEARATATGKVGHDLLYVAAAPEALPAAVEFRVCLLDQRGPSAGRKELASAAERGVGLVIW
mmetsp:Transcript_44146/g.140624  ORF Transcript_44146/g.140624 Transcript_44146/m.140624 type:complete len:332 (+) Transcript_44146:546-1541(+)